MGAETATLTRWAFESRANTSIFVGDTGSYEESAIPEPSVSFLLLFGLGAAWLRRWLKSRHSSSI